MFWKLKKVDEAKYIESIWVTNWNMRLWKKAVATFKDLQTEREFWTKNALEYWNIALWDILATTGFKLTNYANDKMIKKMRPQFERKSAYKAIVKNMNS